MPRKQPLFWRDQYSAMVWPVRAVTYREDGWPLCPVCGHDEVYCVAEHNHRLPCPELKCYVCSFSGPDLRVNDGK